MYYYCVNILLCQIHNTLMCQARSILAYLFVVFSCQHAGVVSCCACETPQFTYQISENSINFKKKMFKIKVAVMKVLKKICKKCFWRINPNVNIQLK